MKKRERELNLIATDQKIESRCIVLIEADFYCGFEYNFFRTPKKLPIELWDNWDRKVKILIEIKIMI